MNEWPGKYTHQTCESKASELISPKHRKYAGQLGYFRLRLFFAIHWKDD